MNYKIILSSLFYFFIHYSSNLSAQFEVTKIGAKKNVTDFVKSHFIGEGIEIEQAYFLGASEGLGEFKGGTDIISMGEGMVMSTGELTEIAGPNISGSTGKAHKRKGDEYLSKLAGIQTNDAMVIEIIFTPKHEYISFNYVFASEEYLEFVESGFNDVFAFIIAGDDREKRNLAIVPGTEDPITINNINFFKNSEYYINNCDVPAKFAGRVADIKAEAQLTDTVIQEINGVEYATIKRYNTAAAIVTKPQKEITYDGLTKVMQAKAKVDIGKRHYLRIAIADAKDAIYDSAVFLENASFVSHESPDFKFGILNNDDYYYSTETVNLDSIKDLTGKYKIQKTKVPMANEADPKLDKDPRKLPTIPNLNIYFDYNSHALSTSAKKDLETWVAQIKKVNPKGYTIQLIGHTDHIGTNERNDILSKDRSLSTTSYLEDLGITSDKIEQGAKGETQPIASNTSVNGRAKNRRVELRFIPK